MANPTQRQLAKAITGNNPSTNTKSAGGVTWARGVVSGVSITVGSTTTTTVQLNGSKQDVPADVVGGYAPAPGDVVEVAVIPPGRLVVMGPIQVPGKVTASGITELTSTNGSVGIEDPMGPTANLSVNSEIIFDYMGTLATGASPPWHSRFACTIVGFAADLGTYSSELAFAVKVGGTSVGSTSMASTSTGHIGITPVSLTAYTSLVTVDLVSAGTGNADLIVHVELGSISS